MFIFFFTGLSPFDINFSEPTVFVISEHSDFQSWLQTLAEVSNGENEYHKQSATFGVPIEELLAKESEGADVPKLVAQCCNYVRQNGETRFLPAASPSQLTIDQVQIKKEFSVFQEAQLKFSPMLTF